MGTFLTFAEIRGNMQYASLAQGDGRPAKWCPLLLGFSTMRKLHITLYRNTSQIHSDAQDSGSTLSR